MEEVLNLMMEYQVLNSKPLPTYISSEVEGVRIHLSSLVDQVQFYNLCFSTVRGVGDLFSPPLLSGNGEEVRVDWVYPWRLR